MIYRKTTWIRLYPSLQRYQWFRTYREARKSLREDFDAGDWRVYLNSHHIPPWQGEVLGKRQGWKWALKHDIEVFPTPKVKDDLMKFLNTECALPSRSPTSGAFRSSG